MVKSPCRALGSLLIPMTKSLGDAVLDRVINFIEHDNESGGRPFWIDKLCINQLEGSDGKEIAIQSMDLIYIESTLSLGLMFVGIDSENHVKLLCDLMCGSSVAEGQNGPDLNENSLEISLNKARKVLHVLHLIVNDS
jgi:Heterokaryon incompatibility protein (HET)